MMIKLKDILNEQVSSDITSAAKSAATTAVSTNNKKDFTLPGNVASQKIWDHIREYESLRLFTYDDKVYPSVKFDSTKHKLKGILTIGYGHTGKDVKAGQTITEIEANKLLVKDVKAAANCIKRWTKDQKVRDNTNNTKYHLLTQGMYDALVDVAFNKGCNSLRNDKLKPIMLNIESGNKAEAANQISQLPGTKKRWEAATAIFNS